ncbi:hypothetical protein M3Y97_00616300 [Aphelenchoides bicaudatus]|nr:hypothetical protein M3Y97_00616300 [Aphelenchoides bicaudatus]
MFQTWFQANRESSNEVLLVVFILFVVLGGFMALVFWIVRLARQNKFPPDPASTNIDIDESCGEEKVRTIRRLELYKQMLNSQEEEEDNQPKNRLAHAVQCLDYYYLNKWSTQLRDAFDTNALDVTVQQVLREIEDHTDLYQLGMEAKQELWDLAQLTDIEIKDNCRGFSFSCQND